MIGKTANFDVNDSLAHALVDPEATELFPGIKLVIDAHTKGGDLVADHFGRNGGHDVHEKADGDNDGDGQKLPGEQQNQRDQENDTADGGVKLAVLAFERAGGGGPFVDELFVRRAELGRKDIFEFLGGELG